MPTTDAILIHRWARDRDPEAFRELVNRYAGMVFSTARRVLGNTADAEDVAQECFLKLCQPRQPVHNIAAWLHRVATRASIDVLQTRSRRREAEKRWEMRAPASEDIEWQDIELLLDEAIEALPENVRAPLVLYYLQNQTQEAVAEVIGVSQVTVSNRVRKGVEMIRKQLQRRGLVLAPVVLSGWLSTQTAEATPATLLARLGKVAVLGHVADRVRGATSAITAKAVKATSIGVLPMKIAVASITSLVIIACLAFFFYSSSNSPDSDPRDLSKAPAEIPNTEPVVAPPESPQPAETSPPLPEPEPALVSGTVRNEKGEPIASADVFLFLAIYPPTPEDRAFPTFRSTYFARSPVLQTTTDNKGRFVFEEIRMFGGAIIGAFKEGHSASQEVLRRGRTGVRIDEGTVQTGIDLVLAEGKTMTGRIVTPDGSPVDDAVVRVHTEWNPTGHVWWPAGLSPTDANGGFQLGFDERTTACHLRINSARYGEYFFTEVPVTDEYITLTLNVLTKVEGTITWSDGTPAAGLTVTVRGLLPEPPILIQREGIRTEVLHDGPVGDDGRYSIEGLHPNFDYGIAVIDLSLREVQARRRPLAPGFGFSLEAGETKVWDCVVPKPITLKGTIRTEVNSNPVSCACVGVRKDGEVLEGLIVVVADDEGFFKLHLTTGPGEYIIHAEPPSNSPAPKQVADLIIERFGKTLWLAGNEEVELDLELFEPTVLPLRVLDHLGEPVKRFRAKFHVTYLNGSKWEGPVSGDLDWERRTSGTLDDMGRTTFSLYYPVAEFWYEIGDFHGGPMAETHRYGGRAGTDLPEETVVLPRPCHLTATLLDPSGKPYKERDDLYLRVVYEDGTEDGLNCRTDERGVLDVKRRLRAAPFDLELRALDAKFTVKMQRLNGSVEGVLDLGEVVLSEEDT